jgi:hypothetical protein
VITEAHIDAKSMKGFARLWFGQSIAACNSSTPVGSPNLQIAVTLSEQNDNFDHDQDGCTDRDELGPGPTPKCGDDPYNPYDSDDNLSANAAALVTVVRTDVGAPGVYFDCIAHIDQAKTGAVGDQEALTTRLQCYTDNPALTVNPNLYPGKGQNPNDGIPDLDDICNLPTTPGSQPASECGDGQPGGPPPAGPPPAFVFADIDATHTQWSGTGNFFDPTTNTFHIEGCIQGVDNEITGGIADIVYARAVIAAHNGALVTNDGDPGVAMSAGDGLVDIWTQRPNCNNPDPTLPGGAFNDALIQIAENFSTKGPNPPAESGANCTGNDDDDGDGVNDDGCPENHYDNDQDGCTDTQELRNTQGTGGLRDPYNRWDFMDQFIGGSKDRSVTGGDIGIIVSRFGRTGSPTGDPLAAPSSTTGYTVSADRGPALPGSNSWNLKSPDGSITGGDVAAVVAQFGHNCLS